MPKTAHIHSHPFPLRGLLARLVALLLLCLFAGPAAAVGGKTALKVGVYENKPLIFTDDDGRVAGLFPEILEHIANKEQWQIEYRHAPWDQLLEQLQQGAIDLLPAIAYSEERADIFSFSDETLMVNWAEVYSSRTQRISSLLDMEGQRVAVKMNDIHLQALRELTRKFGINCRFIETDEYQTIFEMLDAGYLDIGVVNRLYGNANERDFAVRGTPLIFNPIELRFAAPKGRQQDILALIDNRIRYYREQQDSVYSAAMRRWLTSEPQGRFPVYLPYLVGGLTVAFLLLAGLILLLRYQVARQTGTLTRINQHLKQEVSKRQQAVEELKKYARVVEASNDAVALLDRDHNHLLVNNAYLRTFGASKSELQRRNLPEVLGRELYEQHLREPIRRCLAGEQTAVTIPGVRIGSEPKHLNIHLGPYIVSEHYILGYAIDIRDITNQVELENQLKHAQKMETIGMLAGGVAHDLNNILSGLVSYPDMLLVNRTPDDPMYNPLRVIKRSGERAAAIVSDLLTLARRGVENLQPVSLNAIIREFAGSPEYEALLRSAPGVRVELRLDEELLNIMGSPVHLAKCVMNLFSNGLEAMPAGGILTLETANRYYEQHQVPDRENAGSEFVVLTVTDTGVGMDQERINHIFEPFYTSKIMGRSGTGLGMTLVWSAVRDHGGHIGVDSTPGFGTSFTLSFPATREKPTVAVPLNLHHFRGNGETVLVVDDVEEQRRFASEILTMLGYRVETAASGDEAVALVRLKRYDILVLDMIMPGGLDGLATYEQVLAVAPGQKAVIASGFSDAGNVARAQLLGAGAYVRKPYTVLSLAAAIQRELQRDDRTRN